MAGTRRFNNRGLPRRPRAVPEEEAENGDGDLSSVDMAPLEERRPGPFDCPLCGEPMAQDSAGTLMCRTCDG